MNPTLDRARAFFHGRFARFLVGGASTTIVSYAAYLLLLLWLPYFVAYAISFGIGIVWSYFVNTFFVFRRRPSVKRALAFPLIYLVQYVAGSAALVILVEHSGLPARFAPLVVVVLTLPLTYFLSRLVITGDAKPKDTGGPCA